MSPLLAYATTLPKPPGPQAKLFWLVLTFFGGLTLVGALWWIGFTIRLFVTEHKRRTQGLCLHCGYDLTGQTEQCPECGERVG